MPVLIQDWTITKVIHRRENHSSRGTKVEELKEGWNEADSRKDPPDDECLASLTSHPRSIDGVGRQG